MFCQSFVEKRVVGIENLRDGDPLFYQSQGFSPQLMTQIQNTTLSDLIVRDTNTAAMQPDAFVATQRHSSDVASPIPDAPQLVIPGHDPQVLHRFPAASREHEDWIVRLDGDMR